MDATSGGFDKSHSQGDATSRLLPGSEREAAPGIAGAAVALPDDEQIEVTLILRRRNPLPDTALARPIPRDEFADRYGADPADIAQVAALAEQFGAKVVEVAAAERRIRISGNADVLGRMFTTELTRVTSRDSDGRSVTHRHRIGSLSVPSEAEGLVTAVLGLDDRPQAHAQFHVASSAQVETSYTPPQLGLVYEFPANADGSGQTISLIELGGGFDHADLDSYFEQVGVNTPRITSVGVDGASNRPGSDPTGADAEVLLDVEVAGALAPGADIVVYFAPNTDAGFVDAVSQAAHSPASPAAISISWGQSEDEWTAQARDALDAALADAAALGATVTVAAGDGGSADRETAGSAHVDFPASSPHALACGGTSLKANPTTGRVTSETVWNNGQGAGATGGGVSDVFGLPSWQEGSGVPVEGQAAGRGVPDVAANADPRTGYWVRVDGRELTIGGTSAVAPLWAALIARFAQAAGTKFGLIQPRLYDVARRASDSSGDGSSSSSSAFRDITVGNNGAYDAEPGWDACTGLGVPNGTQLLAALTN